MSTRRSKSETSASAAFRKPTGGYPWGYATAMAAIGEPLVRGRRLLSRLHADQRGTISIVSVFALMLLAMLLGMVINVGRQVDGKVKMQNAADAATYSGGTVMARHMNTLVFTNHLLCDIFAVTAFLREASQHNAEQMVPEILAAWSKIGPIFAGSSFQKFAALGPAITQKVPLEQQMVTAYGNWAAATADLILPVWEEVLKDELIPRFQRALVQATPQMIQTAAGEVARRHGLGSPERGPMAAVVWRGSATPVSSDSDMTRRTLPVVDPELDNVTNQAQYRQTATQQRNNLATNYLNQWNNASLVAFDQQGKMSQFAALWRGFTCGQLNKLLNQDYPTTNLPFVLRSPNAEGLASNQYLDLDFRFVGVAYWPRLRETLPGLFTNPSQSDALAFSELALFIPNRRLMWIYLNPSSPQPVSIGGVPGDAVNLPGQGGPVAAAPAGAPTRVPGRESKPTDWDLLNQGWTIKLVPATHAAIPTILQSVPPVMVTDNGQQRQVKPPTLGSLSAQDLGLLNTH